MTDAVAGFGGDGPIVIDHHVPTGTPEGADGALPIAGRNSFIAGLGLPQAQVRP